MKFLNRIIEYSFYSLFFFVPLVFTGSTSELFEFNKMWLAFEITTVIAFAWFTKMVLQKKFHIQRTPLDIPILLFLISQIISTIFSLDQHVSWWGYYSRWNGGLLSTICYIFLYYAFVSNLNVKHVIRTLWVTLASGILVMLWGLPAHFGYDPTCLVFRGTFDTSCWTEAFKPTVRTFSTLGQPAWFAAYLVVLLPLTMAFFLKHAHGKKFTISNPQSAILLVLISLFYLSLIFTNTRAGYIGFFAADITLWVALFYKKLFPWKNLLKYFAFVHIVIFICSFFFGMPHASLNKFTFSELTKKVSAPAPTNNPVQNQKQPVAIGNGITDSGDIRKLVWTGAIKAWRENPVFGTGVETFAYAYYKHKPAEHNMTSEWDYLYNKAHNEYLNYLTTTGAFGLGTYLLLIGGFILLFIKKLLSKNEQQLLPIALFAGWISILITNFFGFSVVIINLFFFLIPAFIFILTDTLNHDKTPEFSKGNPQSAIRNPQSISTNPYQWTAIFFLFIASCLLLFSLFRYWSADVDYALGANLNKAGLYQQAYLGLDPQDPKQEGPLVKALAKEPNEPIYQDELSITLATLAAALYMQKDATNAAQFANNAIALSDQVIKNHPNNVVYWKNRVRILYSISEADPMNQQKYYEESMKAINRAAELAPTDAKIAYNQGVLYGQTGNVKQAIEILENTVKLKPNYRDAYFALGLFYRQSAVDQENKVTDPEMNRKAIEIYEYILKNISPEDKQVQDTLKEWQK